MHLNCSAGVCYLIFLSVGCCSYRPPSDALTTKTSGLRPFTCAQCEAQEGKCLAVTAGPGGYKARAWTQAFSSLFTRSKLLVPNPIHVC